ncbi:MAG: MFS transporter [Cyanobacteria bacterium J06623_5]
MTGSALYPPFSMGRSPNKSETELHPEDSPPALSPSPWLPQLRREIWILVTGQLLLFIGQGFTLVYASIFFVNQLGFSPMQVGLALSSSGLTGIFGRFFAGCAIDSRWLGRRGTLLLAAVVSALACVCLALADTFGLLVAGNMLLGLGLSLYWPATLAVIADLSTAENRSEAFALSQLSNNLGLGVGALLAGQYIALTGALAGSYRALFVAKGLVYLVFGLVIWNAIAETRQGETTLKQVAKNWGTALRDRALVTFLLANIFFAIYGAQLSSSLPLYLANFIPSAQASMESTGGFSEQVISYLFFWHALIKIIGQLPTTRWAKQIDHVSILLFTLILWASAAAFFWLAGIVSRYGLIAALVGFFLVAIAEMVYGPASSALVGEMSPPDQRGIYFSLESECWGIGFLLGPASGGWALDHPVNGGANLWLVLVVSTGIPGAILLYLKQQLSQESSETQA